MSFTVLTAEFSHETNTFSIVPTDYAAFANRSLLSGDSAVRERGNANTDLAGFLDVARDKGWTLIHTLSTSAPPAGLVTRDAYERIAGPIVAAATERRHRLNGIALGLHGAMVTDFDEDGEGELLARLRAVVGADMPIAITLDPHANVTVRMCELANIIVSYKTYPHVDMRDCARQAAETLHRTMAGEIRPITLRVHRPMLEEVNGGRTDIGPMIARIAKARAYEQEPDVFAVSVNGGFGNADIAEVGPTVLVTAQGDLAAHARFAETIADDIWEQRFQSLNNYLSVEAAAAICAKHEGTTGPIVVADYADNPGGGAYGDGTTGPIVVADYADNPGGGAYGDGTNLLRALLDACVTNACLGPMIDPDVALALHGHKVGETVEVQLGGKVDPCIGGGPLPLSGQLMWLSDGAYVGDGPMIGGLSKSWGLTAVLRVAGIDILVVSRSSQMLDLQQFSAFGIDPATRAIVALKSMQHFRAAFAPIAARIIVCDSGALCTPDLTKLPYRRARRPIFPLDQEMR